MWWEFKDFAITVSHIAASNLQNFGPCLSQFREIQLFSRNLTDFVNVNESVYI